MIYTLKNCRNGEPAVYETTVEITERNGEVLFRFTAPYCAYYCPNRGYNGIHSEGDACEILIGSDPTRKVYYEIEISPLNELMVAKMTYLGVDEENNPKLDIAFVSESDCFVKSSVEKTANGYVAEVRFRKADVMTGDGELYFNAYRLETDGGESEKHLFALNPTMRGKFHVPKYYEYLKDFV